MEIWADPFGVVSNGEGHEIWNMEAQDSLWDRLIVEDKLLWEYPSLLNNFVISMLLNTVFFTLKIILSVCLIN
jgi:hypothetical protein